MKTLAAIIICIRMALLPAGAQDLLLLASRPSSPGAEVTQNFDGYTPGVQLATLPGWTVVPAGGKFITLAGGLVTSDTAGMYQAAGYEVAGFTLGANHEAEVTLAASPSGSAGQGVTVAVQPNGNAYALWHEADGYLYFGYHLAGTGGIDYLYVYLGAAGVVAGTRLRLSATGTGAARVCTASYLVPPGGWVTPGGWANRNFGAGKQLDGGRGGLLGIGNSQSVKVDSLTVRNLP